MPTIGSQIGVGQVEPDDFNAHFIPQDNIGNGVWDDYYCVTRYEGDNHIYMMGITSPNGFIAQNGQLATASFVKLASKTLLIIVDWTAARWKDKPRIPDPTPKDTSWVLLDDWTETNHVNIAPDGETPYWRISGTYVYGHINPNAVTINNMNYPRPPWLDDFVNRTIPNAVLDKDLV